MCRHVGYVGPAVNLGDVVLDAPHALLVQAERSRHQTGGVTNRDGWGVAWRDPGGAWCHHRTVTPLPDDASGQALLRSTHATAFIAAVRRASPTCAIAPSGNAPFVEGRWAFSLNGFVGAFAAGARDRLVTELSEARRARLAGDTDSEVLFGLTLDRIEAGADPADALTATVTVALAAAGDAPCRLNLLLGDGTTMWATRWANSLFTLRRDGSIAIASEPWDNGADWTEVPDGSVLTVAAGRDERRLLLAPA